MKKRFYVLFMSLIIILALGGCKDAEKPEGSGTLPPNFTPSEAPSSSATFEYVESTLGNFHISLATDELLNKYDSFHEYISNEDGDRLLIRTDKAIKDFAFIAVNWREDDNRISLLAGDTLFSAVELSPEKPFVVKLLDPGGILPAYGISFVDEDGVKRYYSINTDKRGAEEAPPYFLTEFEKGDSQ